MDTPLRVVRFEDPQNFLDATKEFDDSFMGFCIGSLRDHLDGSKHVHTESSRVYLFGVYREEQLLLCLTKNTHDFAWMLSTPCAADTTMASAETLTEATRLLANSLLTAIPEPATFNTVIGPTHGIDALITSWSQLLDTSGFRIRSSEANFACRVSYATLKSLPLLPETPSTYTTTLATADDLEALVPLYAAFRYDSPWKHTTTREEALAFLKHPVSVGLVWLCRIDGTPAGYVLLGRVTERTIAIRNVYVSPAYRRKGVAEAMVRSVIRHFLGASPYGIIAPEGSPTVGIKEEVNLNVAVEEKSTERLYKRVGFMLPDGDEPDLKGGLDPATGRKAWYASTWRDITLEPVLSSEGN